MGGKRCWALLDSGAADNFIAATTVAATQIPTHQLGMPWAVSLGNGDIVYTTHYALTQLQVGDYTALTCFKVLTTDLAMVLGYPFLLKHRPHIDWKKRTLLFQRRGKEYLVQGYPGNNIPRDELNRVEQVTSEMLLDEWTTEPLKGSHYRHMGADEQHIDKWQSTMPEEEDACHLQQADVFNILGPLPWSSMKKDEKPNPQGGSAPVNLEEATYGGGAPVNNTPRGGPPIGEQRNRRRKIACSSDRRKCRG